MNSNYENANNSCKDGIIIYINTDECSQ